MPLIRSFDVGKKKGREKHIEPLIKGKNIEYVIRDGKSNRKGTINRSGAKCIVCNKPVRRVCVTTNAVNSSVKK